MSALVVHVIDCLEEKKIMQKLLLILHLIPLAISKYFLSYEFLKFVPLS